MGDTRSLAAALFAVSTSPPMSEWPRYVAAVRADASLMNMHNPRDEALLEGLAGVAREMEPSDDVSATPSRLLAALASFVDDHHEAIPFELFEVDTARWLLARLEGLPAGSLGIVAQLELARQRSGGLERAVLALHTATRTLARGRDTRLDEAFCLDMDRRLTIGRAIAPFDEADARGGDPLGDTYHYWANVAAGLLSSRWRSTLEREVVRGVMRVAPTLMTNVRGRLFGNTLFFGSHGRVDAMGLRHGAALGRLPLRGGA